MSQPGEKREDPSRDARAPQRRSPAPIVVESDHVAPRTAVVFGGLLLVLIVGSIAFLAKAIALDADAPAPTAITAEHTAAAPLVPPGPWRLAALVGDPDITIVTTTIDHRSFTEAVASSNASKAQSYRIIKAFQGIHSFEAPRENDRLSLALDRSTMRVVAAEYEISPGEIYQAREDREGQLKGIRLDMQIIRRPVEGGFRVGLDLDHSCQPSFRAGILDTIDDALGGRLATGELRVGGSVKLIADEETSLGQFVRYARLLAIEYRPPSTTARPVRFYAFTGERAKGYFDEEGHQPGAPGWPAPVPGALRTSKFNPKRMHPILHRIMPHNGTDFGAMKGTPIYAAFKGVIDWVGPHGATGNWVSIIHPNGVETGYAHMSKFAPGLKRGDHVQTHQLIGYVGTTGRSTGPHLHFSARRNGEFFDAETLLAQGDRAVPDIDRAAFFTAKAELDHRLDAVVLSTEIPPAKGQGASSQDLLPGEPAGRGGSSRPNVVRSPR